MDNACLRGLGRGIFLSWCWIDFCRGNGCGLDIRGWGGFIHFFLRHGFVAAHDTSQCESREAAEFEFHEWLLLGTEWEISDFHFYENHESKGGNGRCSEFIPQI
jgi:hypothetical protein